MSNLKIIGSKRVGGKGFSASACVDLINSHFKEHNMMHTNHCYTVVVTPTWLCTDFNIRLSKFVFNVFNPLRICISLRKKHQVKNYGTAALYTALNITSSRTRLCVPVTMVISKKSTFVTLKTLTFFESAPVVQPSAFLLMTVLIVAAL